MDESLSPAEKLKVVQGLMEQDDPRAAGIYEIDGKDTWFEYGLGANFNISTNTYMWADVERTSGGVLDEDWRATVGVRYSW